MLNYASYPSSVMHFTLTTNLSSRFSFIDEETGVHRLVTCAVSQLVGNRAGTWTLTRFPNPCYCLLLQQLAVNDYKSTLGASIFFFFKLFYIMLVKLCYIIAVCQRRLFFLRPRVIWTVCSFIILGMNATDQRETSSHTWYWEME